MRKEKEKKWARAKRIKARIRNERKMGEVRKSERK
jgi:hypothetical protein